MEGPEELTFQLLREITDGFSEERKVGKGAFGAVYRGVTRNGKDVAVKILQDGKDLDYRKFQNELYNLVKVKHNNIVQVLGYCYEIEQRRIEYHGRIVLAEETHRALCFEYLHNGSLQNHLSDESCGLDWHTRYRIIKGTCEGLKYIHKNMGDSLLHLDLKPDNILLDKNMVPKIADFGLSKIFGDVLTRTTQSPLGTLGYQPPEYIERGEISEKFDIFSLGAIILKIVSGPSGYFKYLDNPDEFIDHVQGNWRKRWQACSNGFLLEVCCRQLETCTQIALDCLKDNSQQRPDIIKIIDKLNEIETDNYEETQILQPPENGHTIICGMTRHSEMMLTKEPKVITDQYQHSNFMRSSRSNEVESDNKQETLVDVGEELIVGRDEEAKKIMASLLESIKSEMIVILPIYGIGGIGKTTFARLIYNDTNFKYYSHVWVHVSQRFDLEKIGKSIDSQLSGKENNQANEQLTAKKIMIVLDDLWEDNPLKIEELKHMLNLGDRIRPIIVLVTTRTADIAQKICRNIEPHQIEPLTDEMCWDIIKQKSHFGAIHDKEKLVDIGEKIAKKCGGVALAAQTLGSMLRSMNHDKWMTVKDSDIWNETISEDTSLPQHVLASLKLSYAFSMDDFLKKCFTYCAIFPKGHKIFKYDLIYQWISLGFIMPTKILSTLQLCEKYIKRLLGLTFLQHSMSPTTYGAYGEQDTVFTMHDLVHDLAISVLGDKILDQRKHDNTGRSSCSYALLTDCSKPLESCTASLMSLSALRFLDCRLTELHGPAFEPAEALRVLDLSECSIHKLPDSIGRLKQLRYLNAPRIRDRMIPECISKLSKLMYLSLRGSWAILALPESIGEMESLVHLDLSGCMGIAKLPQSFGNLKSLEHVDFSNCKNVSGGSRCLSRLTKLQYLNLSHCKNIGYLPRALGRLTELQYLNLSNSSFLPGGKLSEEGFLGSLTKLKYLNLSHHLSNGKWPASFGSNCPNLVYIDLSRSSFLQDVGAALNGLSKLQHLDLYACSSFDNAMEGLQEAFGNLSELRHLNLGYCIGRMSFYHKDKINGLLRQICTLTNLEYLNLCRNDSIYSIPESVGNLRMLHTLDVSWCGSLHSLPASLFEIDRLKLLYTMGCWNLDRSMLPQYMSSSINTPYFVVHTGDGQSSSSSFQLKYEIQNRLKISSLENVKSSKEAHTIKLVEKTDITGLALEWTRDAKRFVEDADVLRELEPPYSVSKLRLEGYNSVNFPSWMMRIGAYLPRLVRIDMWDLPSCNKLPQLGQLPNLKLLDIRQMDSIKKIDADLYGGTRAFPRLRHFRIVGMKCLEEWNMAYSSDEDSLHEPVFPYLRYVEIRDCPWLRFQPRLPRSIRQLLVESSDQVLLSSWGNRGHVCASTATSLQRWSDLTSLHTLIVKDCEHIVLLPERLGDLRSLTVLEITDCRSIKTLPDSIQELTNLQRLEISGCPELVQWCKSEKHKIKLAPIKKRYVE